MDPETTLPGARGSDVAELSDRKLSEQLVAEARRDHEARLRIAKWLRVAARRAAASPDGWTIFGVAGIRQFCEEILNLPAGEGRYLLQCAEACERSPDVAAHVASGELNLAKAGAIGSVLEHISEAETALLLDRALTGTTQETRTEVARLHEEARTRRRTVPVTLHLTHAAVGDLRRACDLLTDSRGGPRATPSRAVSVALAEYVDRRDPERAARRARVRERGRAERCAGAAEPDSASTEAAAGAPATEASSPSRRIPAAERHAVLNRFGDVCWFAGCDERGTLQYAHDKPFRLGGANTASNLARWCRQHHRGFDSGRLKVRDDGGRPVVVSRRGEVVGRLRTEPP